MGQQLQPDRQLRFGGVDTSGHPLERPAEAASKCENFRVMRGGWLRLRSGYKKRLFNATGRFLRVFEYRSPGYFGHTSKLLQWTDGASNHKWRWLAVSE